MLIMCKAGERQKIASEGGGRRLEARKRHVRLLDVISKRRQALCRLPPAALTCAVLPADATPPMALAIPASSALVAAAGPCILQVRPPAANRLLCLLRQLALGLPVGLAAGHFQDHPLRK